MSIGRPAVGRSAPGFEGSQSALREHVRALRVALHPTLLPPMLQVMADERTGGADLARMKVSSDQPPNAA